VKGKVYHQEDIKKTFEALGTVGITVRITVGITNAMYTAAH
jgi:hypothetical protein